TLGNAEMSAGVGMGMLRNAADILPDARWEYRMGDKKAIDMMVHDVLTCSFNGVHMGTYGNSTASDFELSREEQDEWAYRSHARAIKAQEEGKFKEESVPVEVPQRRGDPIIVEQDEAPRKDTTLDK